MALAREPALSPPTLAPEHPTGSADSPRGSDTSPWLQLRPPHLSPPPEPNRQLAKMDSDSSTDAALATPTPAIRSVHSIEDVPESSQPPAGQAVETAAFVVAPHLTPSSPGGHLWLRAALQRIR